MDRRTERNNMHEGAQYVAITTIQRFFHVPSVHQEVNTVISISNQFFAHRFSRDRSLEFAQQLSTGRVPEIPPRAVHFETQLRHLSWCGRTNRIFLFIFFHLFPSSR